MGGSYSPSFTKNGKIWKQKGHLHSHLNQLTGAAHVYHGCELVTFEMVEEEVDTTGIQEYLEYRHGVKVQQEREQADRYESQQTDKRRNLYLSLQQEFGEE